MVGHLLTEEIIKGFNKVLENENSILRVHFEGTNGYIKFIYDKFVNDTSSPHINDEFVTLLNSYLKDQHDLSSVSFNNTRSTFWVIG